MSAYGDAAGGRARAVCDGVVPCVLRLARDAPCGVRDALRFAAERLGPGGAAKIAPALEACRDDAAEAFVVACQGLHEPLKRLYEGVQLLTRQARDAAGSGGPAARERCRQTWAQLDATLLSDAWPGVGEKIGDANARFVQKMQKKLRKRLGPLVCGAAPASELAQALAENLRDARDKAASVAAPRGGAAPLERYSTWLRDFDGASTFLEVPGGVASENARVACFEPTVKVLSSKQLPKRLTVRATDGLRVDYLVKGGEDLRNDARVEALFAAMADVLAADVNASRRGLGRTLRTYAVVPLSPRVGLVEWVPRAPVLGAVLRREFGDGREADGVKLLERATAARNVALFGPGTTQDGPDHARRKKRFAAKMSSARDAFRAARRVLDARSGGLRRHLAALAPSAEAFLAARRTYRRPSGIDPRLLVFGFAVASQEGDAPGASATSFERTSQRRENHRNDVRRRADAAKIVEDGAPSSVGAGTRRRSRRRPPRATSSDWATGTSTTSSWRPTARSRGAGADSIPF